MKGKYLSTIHRLHYIEAFDHTELIYRWLPVWGSMDDLSVYLHVSQRHLAQANMKVQAFSNIVVCSPGKEQSWPDYLKTLSIAQADVAVIATIGRRPEWFLPLISRLNYGVIFHNLNYCFGRVNCRKLNYNLRALLQRTGSKWRGSAKWKLLAGAIVYMCPTVKMTNNCNGQNDNIECLTVPFAFRNNQEVLPPSASNDHITVVVPGTVKKSNRNYSILARALIKAKPFLTMPVAVHLSGKVKDRSVVDEFKENFPVYSNENPQVSSEGIRLIYYPDGLSEIDYSSLLTSADLLVAPLNQMVNVGGYTEELSETKVTGAVYDAIYYNKPIILPEWYHMDGGNVRFFKNEEDLAKLFNQFSKQKIDGANWDGFSKSSLTVAWRNILETLIAPR